MTKNHTFIRSLVLSASLIFTAQVKAEPNRLLVAYYDQVLFGKSAPLCTVNDDVKSNWLKVFDDKRCFLRQQTADKQLFISGVTSPCTVDQIKAAIDKNLSLTCATAAAAKRGTTPQQTATTGGSGGGGQNSGVIEATTRAVQEGLNATVLKGQPAVSKIFGNNSTHSQSTTDTTKNKPVVTTDDKNQKTNQAPGSATTQNTAATTSNTQHEDELVQNAEKTYNEYNEKYKLKCQGSNADKSSCNTLLQQVENKEKQWYQAQEHRQDQIDAQKKAAEKAAKENLRSANKEQQKAAEGVLGEKAEIEASKLSEETKNRNYKAQLNKQSDDLKVKNAAAHAKSSAEAAPVNCHGELHEVEAAFKAYNNKKEICESAANTAYNFCDKVNSPGLKQVQQFMTLSATALSNMTAATDACRTTSTISKVAQAGVLGAQLLCTTTKIACDKGCAAAEAALAKVKEAQEKLEPCATKVKADADAKYQEAKILYEAPDTTGASKIKATKLTMEVGAETAHAHSVTQSAIDYKEIINGEEENAKVTPKVSSDGKPEAGNDVDPNVGSALKRSTAMCKEKAAVDIALMGSAAVGLLSAYNDAEKCKEQLSAGNSSGSTTSGVAAPTVTTADYCAIPENAATITCKCTADPNAAGCVGGMANSGVVVGKVDSGSGPSGFASAKQNGLGAISSLDKNKGESGEAASGTGLSAAAREALGIGSGALDAAGTSGGAADFGSGAETAGKGKDKNTEEPKKFGFFSSVGSALGFGRKPDSAAKAAIRSYEQEQAIQRKIASEKVRAEVTTASGKSNFDKIKNAYRTNLSSFEQ